MFFVGLYYAVYFFAGPIVKLIKLSKQFVQILVLVTVMGK